MRYPFVLLDVGQTLVGPRESFGAVYSRVLRGLGIDVSADRFQRCILETLAEMNRVVPLGIDRYSYFPGGEDDYWLRFSSRTVEKATARSTSRRTAEAALAGLRQAFDERSAWLVFPDVLPALKALKAAGARLGVVSNWDSRLPRILEMLGLARYFDALGVSHLEGVEKPDPAIFRRVLEKLGADPREALHVGDVPELDLAGAGAAGVDGLLIDRTGDSHPSPATIPDLSDLPRIASEGFEALVR